MTPEIRKKWEFAGWIAGIAAAIFAGIALLPHRDDKPAAVPQTTIDQTGNQGGTQIGKVTGGTVNIYNKEAKPSVDPQRSPTNRVFGLTGSFAKPDPPNFGPPNPPKPLNYYLGGVVSVTYIPKTGDSPYVTVCFLDAKAPCVNNTSIQLNPGTFDYKYIIYEPDSQEWSPRKLDTVRACIGDAKRITDYYNMSAENQAAREEPACLKKDFERPR